MLKTLKRQDALPEWSNDASSATWNSSVTSINHPEKRETCFARSH